MKKQLNESAIASELRGQSIFFRSVTPPVDKSVRTDERTPVLANDRTTVRTDGEASKDEPPRRPTKRHPFEIYADQLKQLQTLKAQALMEGQSLSMSELVREALDQYLSDHA